MSETLKLSSETTVISVSFNCPKKQRNTTQNLTIWDFEVDVLHNECDCCGDDTQQYLQFKCSRCGDYHQLDM